MVADAATPWERLFSAKFSRLPTDRATLEDRERRWIRSICGKDRAAFYGLMSHRGLTDKDVRLMLHDVCLSRTGNLPEWAATLAFLLEYGREDNAVCPELREGILPAVSENLRPIYASLAPFLAAGRHFLEESIERHKQVVTENARTDMLRLLADTLSDVTGRVLFQELQHTHFAVASGQAQSKPEDRAQWCSTDQWLIRFQRFPVVGRLISVAFDHWLAAITEMLHRLRQDAEVLGDAFFDGVEPGALTGFHGAAGDAHQQGRAVRLLTFENGGQVVYKPKDLRIAAWFLNTIENLNQVLTLPLQTRRIIARNEYAWEEYVGLKPCETEIQVKYFYQRMGMFLRLLQHVGGRDFHFENIIPCGEHPIPVDLESVMCPHPPSMHSKETSSEAMRRLESSALSVGMLSMTVAGEAGRRVVDLGAFVRPGVYDLPFKSRVAAPAFLQQPQSALVHHTWETRGCVPVLNGNTVDPAHYVDDVLDGYREMSTVLKSSHGLGVDVAQTASFTIRYLFRHSQVYARLLASSLDPDYLTNGVDREIRLEKLWKAYYKSPRPEPGIFQSEIDALRRLDIPTFYSQPGTDCLILGDGHEIDGYFDKAVLTRGKPGDDICDQTGAQYDCDIVQTALSLISESCHYHPVETGGSVDPAPEAMLSDYLEQAIGIGDMISNEAYTAPDGEVSWIGLNYYPSHDHLAVEQLSKNVISGTAGLALLFTDLYRASALSRFKDLSCAVLSQIRRSLEQLPREIRAHKQSRLANNPRWFYCGGFFGLGAAVYAIRRCADVIDDPELSKFEARLGDFLPEELLACRSPADIISGKAGLLMALTSGSGSRPIPGTHRLIDALTQTLLDERDSNGRFPVPPYPKDTTRLNGLPGTEIGIALALVGLAGAGYANAEDLVGETGNFPTQLDTVGDRLGKLALSISRPDLYGGFEVSPGLAPSPGAPSRDLLDELELAITVYQCKKQARFHDRARSIADIFIQRKRESGKWFPDLRACDRHNLCSITGVGAIAFALLKVYDPSAIPSLRLLA